MTTVIDIRGIDKIKLLHLLWDAQNVAGFYRNMPMIAPRFDQFEAETAVTKYIDYFCGRCIKTDLSGDTVDPDMYDRDAGPGMFAAIVADIRKGM